jgi:hypothetical protein
MAESMRVSRLPRTSLIQGMVRSMLPYSVTELWASAAPAPPSIANAAIALYFIARLFHREMGKKIPQVAILNTTPRKMPGKARTNFHLWKY